MASQSRCFPYEKSIIINALYDTIEALGLSLDSADSLGGMLSVSDGEHMGKMRIALGFGVGVNQTRVEVFPEDTDGGFAEIWSPVVFDELAGSLKRLKDFCPGP